MSVVGRRRGVLVAALAATAVVAVPVAVAYTPPKTPAAEQTHPTVQPRSGGTSTTFTLTLTARDEIGVRGILASDYRISASTRARGSCAAGVTAQVASAARGRRVTVALTPHGAPWCRGRYRGLVLLERGPYCPRPAPGQPPRPCPEFASQALDAGRFVFRVR